MPYRSMRLFYRSLGKGSPVVILHGLYGASDNWMTIARILAEKYRVITVDLRNHGRSPHHPVHTYEAMVIDIARLFDELEIESACLIGHSMGGKLAMAFAADYPEKIRSLTVADIAPKNYLQTPASGIQLDLHNRILETLSGMDMSQYSSRKEIESALEPAIPDRLIRMFILKNLKKSDDSYEWRVNAPVLFNALPHILESVNINEYRVRIPIASYPVLFIKGSLSGYIINEDEILIREMYPEAKITEIKGASHFLHAEKPVEFGNIVKGFLQSESL
ncbi:MAG: alpha/beta fold hydrolase [Prolixibacteraceae bacterium]|nr:alpha/beta fold hydrolase [Prolixibacteraceae bacterium]